jgi:hypothetical protein
MAEVLVDEVLLREPNLAQGKKPIGKVRIDWEHPLSRGLIACWVFQDESFKDLCGNYHGTKVGTVEVAAHGSRTADKSLGGLGAFVDSDGTNSRIDLGSITSSDKLSGVPSKNISGYVYSFFDNDSGVSTGHGNTYPRWIDKSTSGSAANGWAFYQTLGATQYITFSINGTNHNSSNLGSTYDGADRGCGFSASDAQSTSIVRFFMEGKFNVQRSTGKNYSSTTSNAALLNWNHSTDRQYRFPVYCIYIWDRFLSDEEHAEIHRDRYQILKPA